MKNILIDIKITGRLLLETPNQEEIINPLIEIQTLKERVELLENTLKFTGITSANQGGFTSVIVSVNPEKILMIEGFIKSTIWETHISRVPLNFYDRMLGTRSNELTISDDPNDNNKCIVYITDIPHKQSLKKHFFNSLIYLR